MNEEILLKGIIIGEIVRSGQTGIRKMKKTRDKECTSILLRGSKVSDS
jgi:hypothetical protein